MTDAEVIDCPRCAGGKEVTADRIRELMRSGHPVQDWKPGQCEYCGGVGRVPAIVAELVPLHDITAMPDRPAFADVDECLRVIGRLERAPFSACRDDAWASAACLLAKAEWDRGDLPAELLSKARPFLFGNSLGRVLAAEIAMEFLTVGAAVELAFSPDHPRAADVGPLGQNAPAYLMVHHELWMDAARGREAADACAKRIAGIADPTLRGDTLVVLLKALAAHCGEALADQARPWAHHVAELPVTDGMRSGRRWPRSRTISRICDEVLTSLPESVARHWHESLMEAVFHDCERAHALEKTSQAFLYYAVKHWGPDDVDVVFSRLCAAIQRLPDRNEWAGAIGDLAEQLSRSGAASEERLNTLIGFVNGIGLDDAWIGAGRGFSRAVTLCEDVAWAPEFFRRLLGSAAAVRTRDNQSAGISELGGGLQDTRPAWAAQAFESLVDGIERLFTDGNHRANALDGVGQSLLAHWREPYFHPLFGRLLDVSANAPVRPADAFRYSSWVVGLSDPIQRGAEPDYCAVFPTLFAETIEAIRLLPVEAQVTTVDAVASGLSSLAGLDAYADQFQVLLRFLDGFPVGEALRTTALSDVASTVCNNDKPFDAQAISEIGRRLLQCPAGPKKLEGVSCLVDSMDVVERSSMRASLDVPDVSLTAFSCLGQADELSGHSRGRTSGGEVVARLAWLVETLSAPLPGIESEDYEALFAALGGLGETTVEHRDMNQQVLYRGVPRQTVRAALLRRIGPVGDDAWRLGFIRRVLDGLRAEGKPEQSRHLVHAILHALGTVEIGAWHKEALELVLAFLTEERQADDSVLRRGVVAHLVRVGDVTRAARVAREVSSPALRSEALAEVARAMATALPDDAVALLQEIVSPEIRTRLAVELSASLSPDAERAWVLLETAASDPSRLQEIAVRLLARDPAADAHDLLASLGWTPAAAPEAGAATAVLAEMVAAECITAKKRDRILDRMTPAERAAIEADVRVAAVAALVRLGLVAAEEAADFAPRGP